MKFRLGPRHSLVFGGKRIINNSRQTVELVILDEPGRHIVLDADPYPEKQPQASAPARARRPKANAAAA